MMQAFAGNSCRRVPKRNSATFPPPTPQTTAHAATGTQAGSLDLLAVESDREETMPVAGKGGEGTLEEGRYPAF